MIPLRFKPGHKDIFENIYNDVITRCKKRHPNELDHLDRWCRKKLSGRSFHDVVMADFADLQVIVKEWDDKHLSMSEGQSKFLENYLYNTYFCRNRDDRKQFIGSFQNGVTVCPYCNRNYINSLKDYDLFQLDHFYPESKYPVLAISFYNLVPVCPACNYRKRTYLMHFSPYDKKWDSADQIIRFDYDMLAADYLTNEDHIRVVIMPGDDSIRGDVMADVDLLNLDSAYDCHRIEVQEMLKKGLVYPEDRVDEIYSKFPDLFNDREEVVHLVYGASTNEKRFTSEPLSKMKSDILKLVVQGACVNYAYPVQ